ncbi:hypothetical protein HAX54_020997 [Datura stramonium]|uniref:Calcium uniporter protein C-terminal domain-containing protein n=1 Tax=Datura stramonium TaxID=4076 RepID=A0ABS8S327_DATST|nr:hypothetical protein [Datura stramonium]
MPDSVNDDFFRWFLQRREINHVARLPEFLSIPVGEKLREKLRSMNVTGERIRFESVAPPAPETALLAETMGRITVNDAKKILKISHWRNVIVLGDVVFVRPHQVAKSMDKIISESIASPNDPRRKELEDMEKQKNLIDQKAQSLVKGELYCGLGLKFQTLGFMRLTFWELTWDVMEPICFFVTSLHFALAYGFFLRTSKEPTFEGYFQRRFKVKQKKLMKTHNFDLEKGVTISLSKHIGMTLI